MSETQGDLAPSSPLRVLEVEIDDPALGNALVGKPVPRARLIFQNMLPVEAPARLAAVVDAGVVIEMAAPTSFDYVRVMVPWTRIEYVTVTKD